RVRQRRVGRYEHAAVEESRERRKRALERGLRVEALGARVVDDRRHDRLRLTEALEKVGGGPVDDARHGSRLRSRQGEVVWTMLDLLSRLGWEVHDRDQEDIGR